MNPTTDFDRLVTSWLETAGPSDMRPEAVEAALATARRTTMRRGIQAFLVGPGRWPRAGSFRVDSLAPAIRVAIVIGLLAALVAGGLIVSSRLLQQRVTDPPFDSIRTYQGRITQVAPGLAADGFTSPIALADGSVLGFDHGRPLLWDAETRQMRNAGALNAQRYAPIPVVLTDGRVLIIGGDLTPPDAQGGSSLTTPTAEVWDPRSNTSSSLIPLPTSNWISAAVRLNDGRVLVAGGITSDGRNRPVATAALFDPAIGAFMPTGSMSAPRFGNSMALLPDGRAVVIGGSSSVGDGPDTASTEIYDPVAGTFSPGDPLDEIVPSPDDSRYPLSTRSSAVTLAGGEVLVPGLRCQEVHALRADGRSDGARETPIERFDPATKTFNVVGTMPHCVHTAIPLPNGELYVLGWWYDASASHQWAGLYDPRTGDVRELDTPSVNAQPYIHIAALADGRVVFFGAGVEVMD